MRGVVPRSRSKSSQTSGASRRSPPIVRGRHSQRGEVRGPRTIRAIAPGDAAPGAGGQLCRDGANGFRATAVGDLRAGRVRGLAAFAPRDGDRWRPAEHGQRRRDAERVRQLQPVQRPTQRGVVAEFGIAEHRGDVEPGRTDLAQQCERQPPLLLKPHRRRNFARCRASG